jgi:dCTP deaminase
MTAQKNGVLVDTSLYALHKAGGLTAQTPLAEGQIQPASVDLRLGAKAYRVQAGFLPASGRTVESYLPSLCMSELDLTKPQLLERGAVYIVPLQEGLKLPAEIVGSASPKSSTGRLDIFVRLVLDGVTTYDTVPAGYSGPMYLEISPLTFPIVARMGDRLSQLRLRCGEVRISDTELQALHKKTPLMRPADVPLLTDNGAVMNEGLWISIDLHGPGSEADPIIGYRARHHTQPVDLAKVGHYPWDAFWEPIRRSVNPLILYPEEFYIFASREGICVPPSHAAELVAYDTRIGEIRVHYAGFFDPGFGYDTKGGTHGTRAVLEVRAHDVPCVLEHGQPIGRFLYEKLVATPEKLYGSDIGSNYAGQTLKLAKQFIM